MNEKVIEFDWREQHFKEQIKGRLQLVDLSAAEIKEALNKAPAKYAYWGALLATVQRELSELQSKYDLWYAKQYAVVDEGPNTRKPEGWKKQQIYLDNAAKIKSYFIKLHHLTEVRDKVKILSNAYEIQSRTLQSLNGTVRKELNMLGPSGGGHRNLNDQ